MGIQTNSSTIDTLLSSQKSDAHSQEPLGSRWRATYKNLPVRGARVNSVELSREPYPGPGAQQPTELVSRPRVGAACATWKTVASPGSGKHQSGAASRGCGAVARHRRVACRSRSARAGRERVADPLVDRCGTPSPGRRSRAVRVPRTAGCRCRWRSMPERAAQPRRAPGQVAVRCTGCAGSGPPRGPSTTSPARSSTALCGAPGTGCQFAADVHAVGEVAVEMPGRAEHHRVAAACGPR